MKRWQKGLMVLGLLLLVGIPAAALAHGPDSEEGYYAAWGLWDPPTQKRVAELLGLTPARLQEELEEGMTLREIAEARGVAPEQVVEAIMEPRRDLILLRAKYGYLSDSRAQDLIEELRGQAESLLDSPLPGAAGPGYTEEREHYPMWEMWEHCPMMRGWGGGRMFRGLGGMMGGYMHRMMF